MEPSRNLTTALIYLHVTLKLTLTLGFIISLRYILPVFIGAGSVILRWITDFTCTSWSQTCKVGSDVLLHIYQVVFFFIVIIAATKAKQIGDALKRLKKALEVMADNGSKDKKD